MEEEVRGPDPKGEAHAQGKRSLLFIALFLIAVNIAGNTGLFGGKGIRHPFLILLSAPIIVFCLSVSLFEDQLERFIRWTFGTIGHVQIFSPELEQRVRARYQPEIRQLEFLGFSYLFAEGETFSLFRFLLIFPVLIALAMRSKREVTAIYNGTSFLAGHPIFASADKTAYGHPNGLGVKFHTVFHDGTILVTKNYGDSTGYASMVVVSPTIEGASISDLWTVHQRRIRELEAEGKRIDNPISFEKFAQISHDETAL